MTLDDVLQDIYALEDEMRAYERKYGILSETFYESYVAGEEPPDEAWVRDWTAWASAYTVWLRRREQYQTALQSLRATTPTSTPTATTTPVPPTITATWTPATATMTATNTPSPPTATPTPTPSAPPPPPATDTATAEPTDEPTPDTLPVDGGSRPNPGPVEPATLREVGAWRGMPEASVARGDSPTGSPGSISTGHRAGEYGTESDCPTPRLSR